MVPEEPLLTGATKIILIVMVFFPVSDYAGENNFELRFTGDRT